MSELKPCPFCGCEAQVNAWTMHGITESRCFCSNSDCPNSVRTVALEQWNTRPIEDALIARIAELEAAQRWIPVSERLPELGSPILFYDSILERINKGTCTAMNSDNTNLHWFTDDDLFYFGDRSEYVTHWMPLPQPPEVQE